MNSVPNALYFGAGHPATGRPCHIEVRPPDLIIHMSEAEVESVSLERLGVKSGGFDHDHLILKWMHEGDERQLYIKDPVVIDALKTTEAWDIGRYVHRSTQHARRARQVRWAWVWISVALSVAVLAGLWFGSDVLVRTAVNRIPIEWEHQLGDATRHEVLKGQRVVTEGPAVAALGDICRRLTEQLRDSPYHFDVTLVRNETVNAMALPGGSVIVYTGLLQQAESPEEVAGVLAHELNHVLLRHGLENIMQSAGIVAIVTVAFGNQQGFIGLLEQFGIQLATTKFSRAKETEADLTGLHLLHEAGISPDGMIAFFERLAKTDGAPIALLSTHPMSAERAARLKSESASLPMTARVPFPFDWSAIKAGL
jgi:Zn-dependent protease with chaperone function